MAVRRSPFRILPLAVAVTAASAAAAPGGDDAIEEIRVQATPLRATSEEVAQPVTILTGDDLARAAATSLGATVSELPGVHSTYFGPAVGRPVIRGLGGQRVRILEDGLPAADASSTSGDHAVSVEPFLADQIEVLKGPSTVLYGSGAIGGVVNTVTGRVPEDLPDAPLALRAEGRVGDVADEETFSVRADGAVGRVAWHVDGLVRRTDAFEIPGFAESAGLRDLEALEAEAAHEEEHGDEEHEEEAPARGTLPNSDLETDALSAGIGWLGESVHVGFAVSSFETEYGLPGGHGHGHEEAHEDEEHGDEHEEEEGDVRIDLEQTRYDLHATWFAPVDGVEAIRLRSARTEYRHAEIEGSGEIGSLFDNETTEVRVEVLNAPVAGFTGAIGLQWEDREFVAEGEEAFVPPVDRRTLALFAYQERDFDTLGLQFGARAESVDYAPSVGGDRDFTVLSASGGTVWHMTDALHLSFQLDLASRAPDIEELYSNGPHLATDTFEIGDADLDEERALNASLTFHGHFEALEFSTSVYMTDFSDFIYLADTGAERDELPVRTWTQGDARFTGVEAEVRVPLLTGRTGVDLRLTGDAVRGELDDAPAADGREELPRIPAARLGAVLEVYRGPLSAEVGLKRIFRQDETAAFELPTDAYTELDAYLGWQFDLATSRAELFLQADNLLDVEQRAHTSFLKDRAPLPGRSLQAGFRVAF
jgi:iron complex outermembrane receptor protein